MTQTDDITDRGYWKERLRSAQEHGELWRSLYICGDYQWNQICVIHQEIIRRETAGLKVLDAGCGYGRAAPWIDDYTGVDLSPDLISLARWRNPEKIFHEADLQALPFSEQQFNLAVAVGMRGMFVSHLGEEAWGRVRLELLRVAKRILVMEYQCPERIEYLE